MMRMCKDTRLEKKWDTLWHIWGNLKTCISYTVVKKILGFNYQNYIISQQKILEILFWVIFPTVWHIVLTKVTNSLIKAIIELCLRLFENFCTIYLWIFLFSFWKLGLLVLFWEFIIRLLVHFWEFILRFLVNLKIYA